MMQGTFRSQFGGLWTDRSDAVQELESRLKEGQITEEEADNLKLRLKLREHGVERLHQHTLYLLGTTYVEYI